MSEAARLVTAEELEKFPDDDRRYELVEGRVICMSPVGFQHGRIVMQFGSLLHQHVQPRKLGVVMTGWDSNWLRIRTPCARPISHSSVRIGFRFLNRAVSGTDQRTWRSRSSRLMTGNPTCAPRSNNT
jgi:hypothetical protein